MSKIVYITGSSKFKEEIMEIAKKEALKGYITLTNQTFKFHEKLEITDNELKQLKYLKLKKIEMRDKVIIVNKENHLTENVKEQMKYAYRLQKEVELFYPKKSKVSEKKLNLIYKENKVINHIIEQLKEFNEESIKNNYNHLSTYMHKNKEINLEQLNYQINHYQKTKDKEELYEMLLNLIEIINLENK